MSGKSDHVVMKCTLHIKTILRSVYGYKHTKIYCASTIKITIINLHNLLCGTYVPIMAQQSHNPLCCCPGSVLCRIYHKWLP